jgi:hypothetical protein
MTQLIYSYTRAQAIADGVLVDVSELAREAGFRFPLLSPRPCGANVSKSTTMTTAKMKRGGSGMFSMYCGIAFGQPAASRSFFSTC